MDIAARILKASNSSNLALDLRENSPTRDVDVVIACGLPSSYLGRALLSLRSEYDALAKPPDMTQKELAHIVGQLPSRHCVIGFGAAWARIKNYDDPELIAMRVTAYWIEDVCPKCHGRGKMNIAGTPSLGKPCRMCNGAGRRREPGGKAAHSLLVHFGNCEAMCKSKVSQRLR